MATYFVSGIDTSCGKTFVVGILARRLLDCGRNVITQKFIQTGNGKVSEDIIAHRKAMGVDLFEEDLNFTTCPYIFKYPASPHLSARLEGVQIDLEKISNCTKILEAKFDDVLIEGAGGLFVPISENFFTIDYIKLKNMPLIFVSSSKLGSINHTIMSLEACKQRDIMLGKFIYNKYPHNDSPIVEDSLNFLTGYVHRNFPKAEILVIE